MTRRTIRINADVGAVSITGMPKALKIGSGGEFRRIMLMAARAAAKRAMIVSQADIRKETGADNYQFDLRNRYGRGGGVVATILSARRLREGRLSADHLASAEPLGGGRVRIYPRAGSKARPRIVRDAYIFGRGRGSSGRVKNAPVRHRREVGGGRAKFGNRITAAYQRIIKRRGDGWARMMAGFCAQLVLHGKINKSGSAIAAARAKLL